MAALLRNWSGRMSLRNRRIREKYCILIILMSFCLVCVMVFFLPDLRAKTTNEVRDVYEKLPDLFLAPHLPVPPPADPFAKDAYQSSSNNNINNVNDALPRPLRPPSARHIEDWEKLQKKIQEEDSMKVLPKPAILDENRGAKSSSSASPPRGGLSAGKVLAPPPEMGQPPSIATHLNATIIVQGGEDSDPAVRTRRDFIRKMTKDAWDSYVKYAWGENELKPTSQRGHSSSIFGPSRLGATIVDAVDTLYIMGLNEEYQKGRDWIASNLDFDNVRAEMSVFETNIRFVGGFLSMYSLTGDTMYKDKAHKLARKLLPAFDTPTGIPYALINLHSGASKNYGWAASGSSILSELGTLHLEFTYLSDVTGDPIFREKVYKIRDVLKGMDKPKGLYSNYVHPRMGKFTQNHVSMGALGDSFYEYLLKSYLQTGDEDAREMYEEAIDAFEKNGLIRYSKNGLLYFAEMRYDRLDSKMDHLACFAGGMLALGAATDPDVKAGRASIASSQKASRHLKMAEGITHTCHESYIRTATKLGPESFRFSDAIEARALRHNEKYYILRPEVIEAYLYMWRITGDPKYREWGWEAAQAIEKHCKAGPGGGYSGIRNVYDANPQQDDVQQTFFFAETMKYLYLLFSSKDLLDFNYWVINTEAHPLPIKATNPYYRPFNKPTSASPSQN